MTREHGGHAVICDGEISRAGAHGYNHKRMMMVRVNDGTRKLDHSEAHWMKSGSYK